MGYYNGYHGHHHCGHGGSQGRPPKLARFCQSAGLLDHEKLSRMSEGEIIREGTKCVGYFGHQAASSFGQMAKGVTELAGDVLGGICGLF